MRVFQEGRGVSIPEECRNEGSGAGTRGLRGRRERKNDWYRWVSDNLPSIFIFFFCSDREITDGKTFKKPRRPFEKERLDAELKIVGEYGLRNKRELWRIQMVLSKLRKTARELLTLPDDDPKRIFDSNALMRRMYKYGFLDETQTKLDYVLALTAQDVLERRLQTLVFKLGLAKSIHHARVLIKQRHIRVGKQIVNVPSFLVRVDSQKHIDFSLKSPFGGGRPGRLKRRNQNNAGGEEEEEED